MLATGVTPDFITVDGGEGGTGAAPVEFTNSVGTPLRDGLLLRPQRAGRRRPARGHHASSPAARSPRLHIMRADGHGRRPANSARGMMFALGCIQARRCHENNCPVGVATTDELLASALDVPSKARRVASYQAATVHAFLELVGAAGLSAPSQLAPHHLWRRLGPSEVRHFGELYDYLPDGALLGRELPRTWADDWQRASADRFTGVAPSRKRRVSLVVV
jgi:hypothetical protein